jgi:hypothetical protein
MALKKCQHFGTYSCIMYVHLKTFHPGFSKLKFIVVHSAAIIIIRLNKVHNHPYTTLMTVHYHSPWHIFVVGSLVRAHISQYFKLYTVLMLILFYGCYIVFTRALQRMFFRYVLPPSPGSRWVCTLYMYNPATKTMGGHRHDVFETRSYVCKMIIHLTYFNPKHEGSMYLWKMSNNVHIHEV